MPFPGLLDRVHDVRRRVAEAVGRGGRGQEVELVAVTKTYGPEAVRAAWECGVRGVGENKVQEALAKMELAHGPVDWHLIGHLQRNKAKHATRFALVHSMDSLRLAEALHMVGVAAERPIRVLAQVNVAGEATKGGFTPAELAEAAPALRRMDGLLVAGVMTMAPFVDDERVLRSTFAGARDSLDALRSAGFDASTLSMGMSHDFEVAVEEGATMVRLGTVLFGERSP